METNNNKTTRIDYKIVFLSEWHCGSGLSGGADLDALVIKDKLNLPYIPGKTIKGLIREIAEDLDRYNNEANKDNILKAFGKSEDNKGECYFSNAELPKEIAEIIIRENTSSFLFRKITSTRLSKDGVIEPMSLRAMQTTIPCELSGYILDIPADLSDLIKDSLRMIKRLAQNRNRGLGRCQISIIEKKGEENEK